MPEMSILITGGTGFLGTNLALAHRARGDRVIAVDNFFKAQGMLENRSLLEAHGVTVLHSDIRSRCDLEPLFLAHNFDVIHHCAAQVAFKRSLENPRLDFEINAIGTFNLLEATRLYCPDAIFLCTSTNQVYGPMDSLRRKESETRYHWIDEPFQTHGIPETHPLDFLSPYGCSKGAADQYALDYARVYGLRTVVIRLSGIYGYHQYSYEDHGWVAFMTKMVMSGETFNRFGNGKQVRDVLFISDIVNFYLAAVDRIDQAKGQAFNVGGGTPNSLSVLELLDLLQRLTQKSQRSLVHPPRLADKLIYISDIRKAQERLDWRPKVSPEEGIQRLLRWLRDASTT